MNRILTIIAILTIGAFNLIAQSSQIVHTVQRGETLASIANTYGVTEKLIIEANPDAAQFIYVGMELTIPAADKTINKAAENKTEINPTDYNQPLNNQQNILSTFDESRKFKDHLTVAFELGMLFLHTEKASNINYSSNSSSYSHSFGYTINVGANYYFQKPLTGPYVGARIGWMEYYSNAYYNESGVYNKFLNETHSIILPIEVGYSFSTENLNWAITPFGSIDPNIAIKGTVKENKEKKKDSKVGGDLTLFARLGIKLRICEFDICGFYAFPLNDKFKDLASKKAFPGITIGYGF